MRMNEFQNLALTTAIYPEIGDNMTYPIMGLASEIGEVCGKYKKILRGDKATDLEALEDELGDVLWYVAMVAYELGTPLEEIAKKNIKTLASRKKRGKLRGSGDNR